MNKRNIILFLSIVVLLSFNLVVRPYWQRKDAVKVVETVLAHWKKGDLTLAMRYWEKEKDSPPIYGLTAYKIGKGQLDKKSGMPHARIAVTLDFPPDSPFPSGKEWTFELNKTRYGWKVAAFRLSEGGMSEQP